VSAGSAALRGRRGAAATPTDPCGPVVIAGGEPSACTNDAAGVAEAGSRLTTTQTHRREDDQWNVEGSPSPCRHRGRMTQAPTRLNLLLRTIHRQHWRELDRKDKPPPTPANAQ
jgi:hypothetical protein